MERSKSSLTHTLFSEKSEYRQSPVRHSAKVREVKARTDLIVPEKALPIEEVPKKKL